MAQIYRLAERAVRRRLVFFTRAELNRLLSLYHAHVVTGEWRDYAIDHHDGMARFAVFRHTLDRPTFTLAKHVSGREVAYAAYRGPARLGLTPSFDEALAWLDRRPRLVVE